MWETRRSEVRTILTTAGLVLLVGLIGALAYEAVTAARAQREVVEEVLRDYAEIAAEQYSGGISLALDYNWFYPVLREISYDDGILDTPGPAAEIRTQAGSVPVTELVTRFFATGPGPGSWIGAGDRSPPDLDVDARRQIVARATLAAEEGWPLAIAITTGNESSNLFVFRTSDDGDRQSPGVVGFEAPLSGFDRVLGRALDPDRILPTSLTGPTGEQVVSVRLVTADGRILHHSGPEFDPSFSAASELGPRLGGMRVEAAIPAGSAERLVIGGLPRSRLPTIGLMLAVAVALLVGGLLVVRRERELLRLRERFVAGASHELRTPLAQIRMFAETLRLDRVRSPEERDRSLEILDREARQLAYLVENLLHFSRPEGQAQRSAPDRLELGELAAEVLEGFAPLAAARNATIELQAREPAVVEMDRDRMRQVLLNLLDNAIKYGPEGQTVRVTIELDQEGRVVVAVDDQGPGVPREHRPLVWTRFWRGPHTGGTTGTGIGLSLVRELVESAGGEVIVSDAPGGGARFRVTLPEAS